MGGLRILMLLAVIAIAANIVAGSIHYNTKGCTDCPECYLGNKIMINVTDVCKYCLCDEDAQPHLERCPEGTEFDPSIDECIPSDRCQHKHNDPRCKECPPCYDDMDIKEEATDPCGYCECTNHGAVFIECPEGQGWSNEVYSCVPKQECCKWPDCKNVECPPCYHGMENRYANPGDVCSFCCCLPANSSTNYEIPHYRQCPYGTEYNEAMDRCVPSNNPDCKHPRPDRICDPCDDCADVTCPDDGLHRVFENKANKCTFCCCRYDQVAGKEVKEVASCPYGEQFDPVLKTCVPSQICPDHGRPENCTTPAPPTMPPTCPPPPIDCDVECPDNHRGEWYRMANPIDKCSFCCCTPITPGGKEYPERRRCEDNLSYDPILDECNNPSDDCPRKIPPPPDNCIDPNSIDGCPYVEYLCAYHPSDYLLKNPLDITSYCQCDHGKAHWMPCFGGAKRFVESLQVCV